MDKHTYREGKDSTATSEGQTYQLDVLFEMTVGMKPSMKRVSDLDWILKYTDVQEERVQSADLSVPVLVYWSKPQNAWITLDGAHRLTKAKREKRKFIDCFVLTHGMLDKARIENVAMEELVHPVTHEVTGPIFNKW